jgi:formyl-CoA transferase
MANQILVSLEGSSKPTSLTVDSPIYVHEVKKKQPQRAPNLGEHNIEVLKELGYDDHDINGLRASGAILTDPLY